LSEELRASHTKVNENGHLWAQRLAEQEKQTASSSEAPFIQAELTWNGFKDYKCDRLNVHGYKCGGQSVLRSYAPERRTGTISRVFIGCKNYQGREKNHMFFSIASNVDLHHLIRLFNRERVAIHQDILDSIDFSWDTIETQNPCKITFQIYY